MLYIIQFGFRKSPFIILALLHLTDKIKNGIVNGNYAVGIYIYLKKMILLITTSYSDSWSTMGLEVKLMT